MKIYHNPRCRKSRETLQLIEGKNQAIEIIEYFKTPISEKELKNILKLLGISAHDLLRKNEAIYKEAYKGKDITEAEAIKAMIKHPKLMERPIVVKGKKAVIGRPPEKVLTLL